MTDSFEPPKTRRGRWWLAARLLIAIGLVKCGILVEASCTSD
jgi:hypothetical protein